MNEIVPSSAPAEKAPGRVELWNPIGFDPRAWLPSELHRHAESVRYIVHRIHVGQVFGEADDDGFVPLMAAILRQFFPGNRVYTAVKDRLIASAAIETDRRYIVGAKAMGYRLGPRLRKVPQVKVPVNGSDLVAKILEARSRHLWANPTEAVHRYLLDWLRSVEIDYDGALAWLLKNTAFEACDLTPVEMLRDGDWFFKVCSYGRCHTNLTNLKSELRAFLRVGGQRLVNLDIRNSQPLIFAILLREEFEKAGRMPADVAEYIELVQAGMFYDRLMSEAGIPPDGRSKFKEKFFGHVFFCETRYETEAAKLFGVQFPNVYRVIRQCKAENYADLAHRLQRAESKVMIHGIAARCMRELPEVFIGTVHDSILTTPAEASDVQGVMMEEFARIGLRPTIRIEQPTAA